MRNKFINLLGSICFCWGVVACTAEPPKEIRSGEIWPWWELCVTLQRT